MKDLLDELAHVQRTVSTGSVPAGEARVVTLSRTYSATPEQVWDALTDADRLARWFLPVSGELRLGGTYQFEGNAGGVIRECEPPKRLLVSWVMGPVEPLDTSHVEIRLSEVDGGTLLELEHLAQFPPSMWDEFGPGAVGVGWDGGLLSLGRHVSGLDLELTPEELGTDPTMRACYTESARAWGAAHRAAGGDPATVQANVQATTAFYVPALSD